MPLAQHLVEKILSFLVSAGDDESVDCRVVATGVGGAIGVHLAEEAEDFSGLAGPGEGGHELVVVVGGGAERAGAWSRRTNPIPP